MRKILLVVFLSQLVSASLLAQGVTTSTLSGSVSDPSGSSLPGANVIATHEPSGTQYGTSVNPNGRYTIVNMRVGGPYKVVVSFVGYQTQTFENITLKLGEAFLLDVTMPEEGTELGEVIVSATQDRLLNSERAGAVTSIGRGELLTMPSVSRSINDMTRFTPQATSTSNGAVGGGNYRQNYITVDGSDFNNTFGIGTNLPAGGSPISLDALEEISVNITPYDVRQSNFIGSAINAVTRAGTNSFSGSAYWFFRSDKQQGDRVRDNDRLTLQRLEENTYGVRIGGPILKNKLFFFVNAEQTKTIRPGQQNFAATPERPYGSDPNVTRPTAAELTAISDYLRNTHGYDTGPFDNYDFESENTKLTGRLDWNINNNHRLSLRYSQVESKSPSFASSSISGSGRANYPTGAGRQNINALWFKNANYYQEQNFYSLALEVNSLFANRFANTFRATYTNQNDPRSTDSQEFPFVDILQDGTPFTSFGYELFSYGNLRDVESYSFVDFVTWNSGIHNFTAGVQLDLQNTKNGFQRFGTGFYVFDSWDDFINGENPSNYAITYPLTPGYQQAFPKVGFRQYSVYGQDEMALSEKFRLTVGLRLDLPTFPDVPEIRTHPLLAGLTFADGEKFDTGVMPDTKVMISPRIGFNYDVKGDRTVQLRGGTGIFTGRVPTVWIVAQSGDAGLLQFTQTYSGKDNTPGPFNKDPKAYLPLTPPEAGTAIPSNVSAIHPDFRFPQTWKSNIAVDAKLPFGFVGSFELIYNKDLNVALGRNVNLVDPQPLNVDGYPDNRPIYPSNGADKWVNPLSGGQPNVPGATGSLNAIFLDNTDGGHYVSATARLERQFGENFSGFISYTLSQSKVPYDGVGDQLLNTWSLTPVAGNPNSPELGYAGYVVPSRVVAGLTFRKEYLKHLGTQISAFFEGSVQGRFSYTYGGDLNRDGQNNDLIYIPRDASEITFTDYNYGTVDNPNVVTAQEQSDLFFEYVAQDEYLSENKGRYAERNGAKMPWRNQLDIKFIQDIFTDLGGKRNTLQFTIDIINFGNMLSKDWGAFDQVNASSILVPTNQNALVPGGGVVPTFRLQTDRGRPVTETFRDNNSITSTWYMQFGLRYIFN